MRSVEIAREVRKANLEAAILSLLRFGSDEGFDAVHVDASDDDGQTVIDLSFSYRGVPMGGESL